jgi:O-antigen/teichoic acid export membrane protein
VLIAARMTPGQQPSSWRSVAREFWWFTAPRAIARVTQTALKRSDIVLVAALASPEEAALYTAATRFIVVGQLFVQSVQQALSPHLSALFAKDQKAAATSVYQAATLWSMIAAWPLYLVLAGFAPVLMAVFGQGYDVAYDVVLILSLTMLLATACGPVDSVLLMAGRSWLSLRNSTVALAVNIGLNVVLIPAQGIRGAAISWAVAIVVRNLLPLLIVGRHLHMWPVTRATLEVAVAAVACFGAADVLAAVTDLPRAFDVALVVLASVVYLGGIWLARDRLDLDAFRSALRRRRRPGRADAAAAVTTGV